MSDLARRGLLDLRTDARLIHLVDGITPEATEFGASADARAGVIVMMAAVEAQ